MLIAISSEGTELESRVDSRFGRAKYFIIYDTETGKFSVLNNTQNIQAAQGAGIQAAQHVAEQNVTLVVSGNLGPKAYSTLNAAGIKTAHWSNGTVMEAVKLAMEGKLQFAEGANVEGHWVKPS